MKWQCVSTAPMDGSRVDLWVVEECCEDGGVRFPDMRYLPDMPGCPSGWQNDDTSLSDCGYSISDVTHWLRILPPHKE